ncbi:glycosyltransferase family 2 protein [Alicyclobacillus tolerans]|nr:glycosyltransferase family 2 protein [Alicyclobacillus tolerans]
MPSSQTDGENAACVRTQPSLLSVVVPAYNEALVIEATYARLKQTLENLGVNFELIFVNDGSSDETLQILADLARRDDLVKVIDFSRNFGHQIAVTAGIEHAQGDVVILIDADLQDPPELIGEFLGKWRQGYDVVYAKRVQRQGETWFKRATAKLFYRTLRSMTEIDIPMDTGDFRLMNRNVVDSLLSIREKHRFIRGLVSWVGFKQIGVPYERAERLAGESKYPLRKMIRFAIDGITSFSFKPLQFASTLGFWSAGIGFVAILAILYLKLFTRQTIQGWTSMMVVTLFLGGIQLIMLGVLGEYIGRIYDEVRDRPLYLVRARYNLSNPREDNR